MMSASQISNNLPEKQSHLWTDSSDESVREEFESLLDSITAFASSLSADGEAEPELNPKGREIVPILPNQTGPVIVHSDPDTPVGIDHANNGTVADAPQREPEVHKFPLPEVKINTDKINWERGQINLTPQLERPTDQPVRVDTPPIIDNTDGTPDKKPVINETPPILELPKSDEIGTAELPEFEEIKRVTLDGVLSKDTKADGPTVDRSMVDEPVVERPVLEKPGETVVKQQSGTDTPALNSPIVASQAGQISVAVSNSTTNQPTTLNSKRVIDTPFQPSKTEAIKGETFKVMSNTTAERGSSSSGNKIQWSAVSDFDSKPATSPTTNFATTEKGEISNVEEAAEIVTEQAIDATEESLSNDQFDAEVTGTPINSEKSTPHVREGRFEIKVAKSDPTIGDKIIDRFIGDFGGTEDAVLSQSEASEPVKHVAKTVLSELTTPIESGETKTLKFRLNPEELGEVEVTLTKNDEGKLDIVIEVENEFVAKTISEGIEFLKSTLSDGGSDVSSLDIFESGKREEKEKQETKESSPTDPGNDDMDQQEEVQAEVLDEDRIISYSA